MRMEEEIPVKRPVCHGSKVTNWELGSLARATHSPQKPALNDLHFSIPYSLVAKLTDVWGNSCAIGKKFVRE